MHGRGVSRLHEGEPNNVRVGENIVYTTPQPHRHTLLHHDPRNATMPLHIISHVTNEEAANILQGILINKMTFDLSALARAIERSLPPAVI